MPELHATVLETLNTLEHARVHLPLEDYAARWGAAEEAFREVEGVFREVAFPSPGQCVVSLEPSLYRSAFNFVAHRLREAAISVELLSAQATGGYSHEWLLQHAPATLGPAPWQHLLNEALTALGGEPLGDLAAPLDSEDPELAAAFLRGLMREALDTLGRVASHPLFLRARQQTPASELRNGVLAFVRRCLAYATTYRTSNAHAAQLLCSAAPRLHAFRQALESWAPGVELEDSAAAALTRHARACLELLELHAPNGDWDAFRGRHAA
ncbi:MAG TPA: hypothetical protein VEZ71_12445 [Archangium sp.]|nr:hypothetical protein [Archangium sp.]